MVTRLGFLHGLVGTAAAAGQSRPFLRIANQTALDRYIALPTPEYDFDLVTTFDGEGYRAHLVSMVSQRWRDRREVDRTLWKHWLTIIEPHSIKTRVGALVIGGGSNGDYPPHKIDPVVAQLAVRTGLVFAELQMVPNQPLTFADDNTARGEDDLVAYTWDRYLRTGDESWPLHLPMTKSAVRAMDTITAVSRKLGHKPVVDRFVVGGASKRGWTSWLTAAADARVVAIVPVVIDALNIEASAEHAYRAYGSWPAALEPYVKMGIMSWLGTPQLDELLKIEDPYSYRDRFTMPKLIVNATGDQFFAPDSWQFYIGALPGENHLRYVPNTDHSLRGATENAVHTGLAFLDSIVAGKPRPNFSWRSQGPNTIEVRSATRPSSVKLWQAVNGSARDFRLQTIGPAFHSTQLEDQGDLTYLARVASPERGFSAYFVELTYDGLRGEPFTVTTGVRVTPDVLPFAPPEGDDRL